MKVLHIINTLQAGGAELHLLTLSKHLKAAGVTVVVVVLKNVADDAERLQPKFEELGIRVRELNADARFNISYVHRCLQLAREEQPQILHTHLPRADIAGAAAIISGSRIPWICSIHDIYSQHWSGHWALPLLDVVWRRADQIVAISQAVRDWLIKQRRQNPKKIRVIHYGLDAPPFSDAKADLRAAMGLGAFQVVGSVGRLESRKGHEVLIRAMPAVLAQTPNARLLIAGNDTWGYGRTLQGLIDELHVQYAVKLVGFRNDIPAFLSALDVFAFASRTEGFGQAVLEAMAGGKPIVTRNIAPLTEMLTDGVTGRLVSGDCPEEWAHAILDYLVNPAKAKLIGGRAQAAAREYFNATRMASETLSLYERVLEERR